MSAQFTPEQVAKLAASGLTPEYAASMGVRPVHHADDLPSELRQVRWAQVPGMLFPWHRLDGDVIHQFRPDSPLTNPEGDKVKYVFASGVRSGVNVLRSDVPDDSRLVIVEGTLQQLAVARYAHPKLAILGIPGCWGWSEDKMPLPDLAVAAGRDVVVIFDADSSTNRDVYQAGKRLEQSLANEGAKSVKFARLGAGGNSGIDDLIGRRPEETRSTFVSGVIGSAKPKPADREPKAKRTEKATTKKSVEATDLDLALEFADRYGEEVRFDGSESKWLVYSSGRWDAETGEVLVRTRFQRMVTREVNAFSVTKDGEEIDERTWLFSAHTMDRALKHARSVPSVMARRDDWDTNPLLWNAANTTLDLETCAVLGHRPTDLLTMQSRVAYDPNATSPQFDKFLIEVLPDSEVRAFVQRLFGMAMLGEVRDHVFAVFLGTGRNGKGVLVRVIEEVFGDYATGVDDTLLVETKFESHPTKKATLHRRRLAVSQETQKDAKWNVAAVKDLTGGGRITARKMRQDDFTFEASHTLIGVTNHRPAVGEGEKAFWSRYREVPFTQDFSDREDTQLADRIIATELPGVLNWLLRGLHDYLRDGLGEPAGVMAASVEAKVESDPLFRFFSERLVKTNSLRDRIPNKTMHSEYVTWCEVQSPPVRTVSIRLFPKEFKAATGVSLAEARTNAGQVWEGVRWAEGGDGPSDANPGPSDAKVTQTDDLVSEVIPGQSPVSDASDASDAKVVLQRQERDIQLHTTTRSSTEVSTDTSVPYAADKRDFASLASLTAPQAIKVADVSAGQRLVSGASEGSDANSGFASRFASPAEPAVVVDIETGDAKDLTQRYGPAGGFFRLGGAHQAGHYRDTTDAADLAATVAASTLVVGHNLISFDLPVLAREASGRVDLLAMTRERRVLDTMVLDSLVNPPPPGMKPEQAMKRYSLDASCQRHGVPGKVDDLKALAKRHGGFDRIPVDDTDYRDYLRGDVAASRALGRVMFSHLDDYAWREMRVAAIAATMTASGFLADQDLLQRRYWQVSGRKADIARKLIARYGLPTTKSDGKPAESPQATKEGKEALLAAFTSLGVDVDDIPTTPKGAPSFGRDSMTELAELYAEHPDVVELCEVVADMAGQRTVYGTALQYLAPDGRVHPEVKMLQASGRWSVTDPGLTVFGKRGGKVVERAIFRPAPGHVLLAADLSQIDARAIAAHSQDPGYLAMFEPGLDAHEIFARMVWGDAAYDSDPKRYRQDIKAITHGMPYGMQPPRMAEHAGVPLELAQQVFDTRRERFPRLVEWEAEMRELAAAGERLDNGFGRLMRPDPDRAFTQAVALMGQGTARDLMMECLLRLPDDVIRMLRAQVHDEIVIECHEDDEAEIREVLREAMTFEWAPAGASHPVQIVADCSPAGRDWAHCYRKD